MTGEFVDTNIVVYAHALDAGERHKLSVALMKKLSTDGSGVLSTQVLVEFYNITTRKLKMTSEEAEIAISDLSKWQLHRPTHGVIIKAIQLQRRYQLAWWDAMIVNSAIQTGSRILWSEDMQAGQRFETVTIRNPFA